MDRAGRKPLLMVQSGSTIRMLVYCWTKCPHWLLLTYTQVSAVGTCFGCLITGLSFLLQVSPRILSNPNALLFWSLLVHLMSFSKIYLFHDQDYQLWKEVTPVLVFVGTLVNIIQTCKSLFPVLQRNIHKDVFVQFL